VLAGMSDEQVVGQLFIVGVSTASGSELGSRTAAAVHAGGYILYGRSSAGVTNLRSLTASLDARLAGRASGVRPFVAADQEGGEIQSLSGPGFSSIPSSLGTDNQPIGRYHREFGSTPVVVAEHGVAVLRGLQAAGVMATGKHFPGLGRVIGNTDVTSGVVDSETTRSDPFLAPFQAAVRAGVSFVMVSSAEYRRIDPGTPAVFSPAVMSMLRRDLSFTGLIASDDIGAAKQVTSVAPGQRAVRFLRAGGQVVVAVKPASVVGPMIAGVLAAQRSDSRFRATVRAAALAVLQQKQRAGLLTCAG
jgi:beta-N-acetylhexosaminidase